MSDGGTCEFVACDLAADMETETGERLCHRHAPCVECASPMVYTNGAVPGSGTPPMNASGSGRNRSTVCGALYRTGAHATPSPKELETVNSTDARTEFVIDKWSCPAGGTWRLNVCDPMPSLRFAEEKLSSHRDSVVGRDAEVTIDRRSLLRFTSGSQEVMWRIRSTERYPAPIQWWHDVCTVCGDQLDICTR